ncbi:MAG: RDD family protein [Prosthecobacter sp.]|nr:RDD family protein [Prosthecobacter sp.]
MAAQTADTLQAVELADGVEIHLRVAGPAVRSAAWLLDLLLYICLMLGISVAVSLVGGTVGGQITGGIILLLAFLLNWFYNVFFEMGKRAATPGQRAMGLKVASVSGGPVRLPQSIIRNLLRVVDFMPAAYLFGFVCCLFNRRFQRLGDLVADTVVVYAEPAARPPAALKVNAEPVAPAMALSRAEQAALVEFLERAPHWSDARKMEMSNLLSPLTERTGLSGLVRVCGMALWIQQGGKR